MEHSLFKTLPPESCKKSSSHIIDSFEYHEDRGAKEKAILNTTFSDASLNITKITVITDITKTTMGKLGLVALSTSEVELDDKIFPCLRIDYLFVDSRYRKNIIKPFNMKVSEMLLYFAIKQALEISQVVGLRYLALRPDGGREHESLVDFYESMNFKYMTAKHEWMLLKLS